MAKKKRVQSDGAAAVPAPRPRPRTARRPAPAPQPEIRAGLDGSPAHEPIVAADDTSAVPADYEPTHDEIAEAAYQRYLQRGGHHGRDFDDWLEAERALKRRRL